MRLRQPSSVRSRKDAKSGTKPKNQNISETEKYVLTAKTSHTSGERKFTHKARSFG